MPEHEEAASAAEAQQDVKASDAKASAAKASDELTAGDLDAVAGGITRDGKGGLSEDPTGKLNNP
jgi:hypothetical protein